MMCRWHCLWFGIDLSLFHSGGLWGSLILYVFDNSWHDGVPKEDPLCFCSPLPRIYGGTGRRGGHFLGWLHCKEVEPALSWYHPLLYDVCDGQSACHLHISHPLPQCAHGWCHGALPVWSEIKTPAGLIQTRVWQSQQTEPKKQVGCVYDNFCYFSHG